MAFPGFDEALQGDAFDQNSFDVDVWNDTDAAAAAAFNPFGETSDASAAFSAEDLGFETTKKASSMPKRRSGEASRSQRKLNVRSKGDLNRRSSFKKRTSRSDLFAGNDERSQDENTIDDNTISGQSHKSNEESVGSKESHSTSSRGGRMDRRPRLARNSSASSKQPNRRRATAVAGKEASMRNLVSLLNSSMDSLEDNSNEKTSSGGGTVVSKSKHHKKDRDRQLSSEKSLGSTSITSKENEKEDEDLVDKETPSTTGLSRTHSTRSRQISKEDLIRQVANRQRQRAEGKNGIVETKGEVPSRGLQKNRSMLSRRNIMAGSTSPSRKPLDRSSSSRRLPARRPSSKGLGARRTKSGDAVLEEMIAAASANTSSEMEKANTTAMQSGSGTTRAPRRGSLSRSSSFRRKPLSASRSGQGLSRGSRQQRQHALHNDHAPNDS